MQTPRQNGSLCLESVVSSIVGCEDTSSNITTPIFTVVGAILMALLSIIIIIGNGLIIVSVWLVKKLREPANYLIVSLALSDFLVGFVVLPMTIVYDARHEWVFGSTMCDVHVSLDVICCTASIMNLCMISVDRYLVITRPLVYPKQRNAKIMIVAILTAWLISALIILPALFGFTKNVKDAPGWINLTAGSVLKENGANSSVFPCCAKSVSKKDQICHLSSHCVCNPIDGNSSMYWNPKFTTSSDWFVLLDLKQVYKVKKLKLQATLPSLQNLQRISIQTEVCDHEYYGIINQSFIIDHQSNNIQQIFEITNITATKIIKITLFPEINNTESKIEEISIYGDKLLGKSCLISQEVWFTLYSTIGAFFLPLIIMLFLNWKIFVEASRFKDRNRRRLSSYSTSQDVFSPTASPDTFENPNFSRRASASFRQTNNAAINKSKSSIELYELNNSRQNLSDDQEKLIHLNQHKNGDSLSDQNEAIVQTEEDSFLQFFCKDRKEKASSSNFNVEKVNKDKSERNILNSTKQCFCHSGCSAFQRKRSAPSFFRSCDTASKTDSFNSKPIRRRLLSDDFGKENVLNNLPELQNKRLGDLRRFPPISEEVVLEIDHDQPETSKRRENFFFAGESSKIIHTRSKSDAGELINTQYPNQKSDKTFANSRKAPSQVYTFKRSFSSPGGQPSSTISECVEKRRFSDTLHSCPQSSAKLKQHEENESLTKRPSILNNIRRRFSSGSLSTEKSKNIKATKTLSVIVGVFTLCWLPFFTVTILRPFVCDEPESQDCMPLALVRVVLWLGYVNSALNPFIYIGFSPDLRDIFRFLLTCSCKDVDRQVAQKEFRNAILQEKRASLLMVRSRTTMGIM